jgi:thymidine phosphorylase
MLVARLRELLERKDRIQMAAAPLKPKPTPQYLQLHGQIAQIAKKLAQAGVYATPEEAIRDAEGWRKLSFQIERFQGQPVVAMETQPLRYSLYTAMWGAENSGIIDRVEQALANAAARRQQRPARNQK